MHISEIPDAKGSHNHNHHSHGHTSKHNPNEVYKSHKQQHQQQQSPPNQVYSHNQRPPKVTHPALGPDDDDNIFGSAEDYDDSDSPNVYMRPTKTSSDGFGANNNHHYPYQSNHASNNNARFNIPLFGSGSNGAGGNVGNGINGNALNGNNGIVTRTDNEAASTATASAIITAFSGKCNKIHSMLFDYNFILFAINLLISMFAPLLAT